MHSSVNSKLCARMMQCLHFLVVVIEYKLTCIRYPAKKMAPTARGLQEIHPLFIVAKEYVSLQNGQ